MAVIKGASNVPGGFGVCPTNNRIVRKQHDKPWKVVAFTYLPSAEKEFGFRIAITGFAYLQA